MTFLFETVKALTAFAYAISIVSLFKTCVAIGYSYCYYVSYCILLAVDGGSIEAVKLPLATGLH